MRARQAESLAQACGMRALNFLIESDHRVVRGGTGGRLNIPPRGRGEKLPPCRLNRASLKPRTRSVPRMGHESSKGMAGRGGALALLPKLLCETDDSFSSFFAGFGLGRR